MKFKVQYMNTSYANKLSTQVQKQFSVTKDNMARKVYMDYYYYYFEKSIHGIWMSCRSRKQHCSSLNWTKNTSKL